MFQALQEFGFGKYFCSTIETIYKKANCSIKMHTGTSPRFDLGCGIRQGCPVSPYLFLICAQLLSDFIKQSPLKGISIADREIIISQLADDTSVFLKNATQVSIAVNRISVFSRASGLHLNLNKCELLPIKDCSSTSICNIPVKDSVTYLGITINKNADSRCAMNFNYIIEKTQKKFNSWLQRDLSLQGRILLSKAEGLSRLTYAATSLDVNKQTTALIDKTLLNFVWKNKIHYIKKSTLLNSYENGGFNLLDFSTLNNTFKINWIRQFIRDPTSIWNFIPNYIFSKIGGLKFLLFCSYNIEKLPTKLANFHKQILLSWSLVYKHNFSPHRYYIWNNRDILYKHRSLFIENWFTHGITLVSQLFGSNGTLLSYSEFLNKYTFPVPPKEYAIVFDAIPSGVIMLFKNVMTQETDPFPLEPVQTEVGQLCFSGTRNNNRTVRSLFQKEIISIPNAVSYWNNTFTNLVWKNIWSLPRKFFITNKTKEVSLKIIHRVYPTNLFMQRYKKDISELCSFCKQAPEDLHHLFWSCPHLQIFWRNVTTLIHQHIEKNCVLDYQNVLFGFPLTPLPQADQYYIINLILFLAKTHIHNRKFNNQIPCIYRLEGEIRQYINTISQSVNKKALRTQQVFCLFPCF